MSTPGSNPTSPKMAASLTSRRLPKRCCRQRDTKRDNKMPVSSNSTSATAPLTNTKRWKWLSSK